MSFHKEASGLSYHKEGSDMSFHKESSTFVTQPIPKLEKPAIYYR